MHVRRSREHSCFEPVLRRSPAAAPAAAAADNLPVPSGGILRATQLRRTASNAVGGYSRYHGSDLLRLRQVDDQTDAAATLDRKIP